MKRRVTISRRPLKDGVQSLFLDYTIGGKRVRENLRLYIIPESNPTDKSRNAETERTADAIRSQKEYEIEQIEAGVPIKASPRLVKFSEFMKSYMERYKNKSTLSSMNTVLVSVTRFDQNAMLQEIDDKWFRRFVSFLEADGNKPNTIRKKCDIIRTVMREADYSGIGVKIPKIKSVVPKSETSIREFLTIEDVRRLDATECPDENVKNAFMFCCFTGLRFSDCRRLTPSMIVDKTIILRQEKTREPVRIPLHENAMRYLPEQPDRTKPFFDISKYDNVNNRKISQWVKNAGIDKHVTFHVARHTFATLLVSAGNDIYSTMRLLGHTSVNTTIRYARMVDEVKKKAVEAIPKL